MEMSDEVHVCCVMCLTIFPNIKIYLKKYIYRSLLENVYNIKVMKIKICITAAQKPLLSIIIINICKCADYSLSCRSPAQGHGFCVMVNSVSEMSDRRQSRSNMWTSTGAASGSWYM